RGARDANRRRMRHLADQRAEQHYLLHLALPADIEHLLRERLPALLRLLSQQQHHIASARPLRSALRTVDEEAVGRPAYAPDRATHDAHLRACLREVVEQLRLDIGEWRR